MGAVVAVKTTHPGTPDDKRREGMKDLGQKIKDETQMGASYVQGLFTALDELVASTDHEVRYHYTDDSGNPQQPLIVAVTPPTGSSVTIFCDLQNDGGGSEGRLRLRVQVDSRSGTGSSKQFNMEVVFPQAIDNNDLAYLSEAAADVHALGGGTNSAHYLTAFKFLSRCR